MKSTADDGALPVDPNGMGNNKAPDSSESSNRPRDMNNVTSDKVVNTSESENRPAQPGT